APSSKSERNSGAGSGGGGPGGAGGKRAAGRRREHVLKQLERVKSPCHWLWASSA
ncbi:DCAF15 isoform 6, partial [Pongo abelii]